MLRIAINDTASEQRWRLQGRLAGPWIPELRSNWERTQEGRQGRKCVVDLSDLTFVDERGEEVLKIMMREGAQFIACGVCVRYLLDKLDRALRRHTDPRPGSDQDCLEWGQAGDDNF
jgi:anti-anti-sigma regulatory factor